MQEMQKELSSNFPFYEPQNNAQPLPQSYNQPSYNSPISNPNPKPVTDNFQNLIKGDEEISTLNKNSIKILVSIIIF